MSGPSPISLCLLVSAARQAMRQAICARVRPHRLTSQEFWALLAVRKAPGITAGELGEVTLLDAPTCSRVVQRLAGRRIFDLGQDRDDRRRVRIHLTARGEALVERIGAVDEELRAAVTRGLTDADLAALRSGLERVVANLAHAPAAAPGSAGEVEARPAGLASARRARRAG